MEGSIQWTVHLLGLACFLWGGFTVLHNYSEHSTDEIWFQLSMNCSIQPPPNGYCILYISTLQPVATQSLGFTILFYFLIIMWFLKNVLNQQLVSILQFSNLCLVMVATYITSYILHHKFTNTVITKAGRVYTNTTVIMGIGCCALRNKSHSYQHHSAIHNWQRSWGSGKE